VFSRAVAGAAVDAVVASLVAVVDVAALAAAGCSAGLVCAAASVFVSAGALGSSAHASATTIINAVISNALRIKHSLFWSSTSFYRCSISALLFWIARNWSSVRHCSLPLNRAPVTAPLLVQYICLPLMRFAR
jgi:hypothetical protein